MTAFDPFEIDAAELDEVNDGWPPPTMALCDRCRMHYHTDEMELVELDRREDPELWCSWCRREPSGWAEQR